MIDDLPRYLVGIDLGTTNSAVAFLDSGQKPWKIEDFPIPQLVAPGRIESRSLLPSTLYYPLSQEAAHGQCRMCWHTDAHPSWILGTMARDHGTALTGRTIQSAKSWLSHSGVDRTAEILPWHGAADVPRISPVEASAQILEHLKKAWNQAHPQEPLEAQSVVLTVPASFDEVARELTLEAARKAGLRDLTLLEEPQAAFYNWIDSAGDTWDRQVKAGEHLLVCDIGGGTCDFSLIQVRPGETGGVYFHRTAVGRHLILGGDNLDQALAHHLEKKLGRQLEASAWAGLLRAARQAKEELLSADAPESITLHLAGGGSQLIGGGRQIPLSRQEVQSVLLEGFLPPVALSARPNPRGAGLQEFGLPYAPDPAISRYLAAFLMDHQGIRPDKVLFNGGFFASPLLRQKVLELLSSWFGGSFQVLANPRLDLAVARGAAYYGLVRRGHGVRIVAGLAHCYYLALDTASTTPQAMCVLPAGLLEGQLVKVESHPLRVKIREPVEFPIYISSTRTGDAPGSLVAMSPEEMTPLPPIRTVLQSGRKGSADEVRVQLEAHRTAIGTLELALQEAQGGTRRWRLAFDVRAGHQQLSGEVLDEAILETGTRILHRSLGGELPAIRPEQLVKALETALSMPRERWPATLLRGFWSVLMELSGSRPKSLEHEVRWLNLLGYCLRPGYGLPVDDWRVGQTWRLYSGKWFHGKQDPAQAQWWILWRRIAGGLTAGQQQTLAEALVPNLRELPKTSGGREASQAEWIRLLGALEWLRPALRQEIGEAFLSRLGHPTPQWLTSALHWSLGRLGSRMPQNGPLNLLIPTPCVSAWLERLLSEKHLGSTGLFALVQMSRRTGDRFRDLDEEMRNRVVARLSEEKADSRWIELVGHGGRLEQEEQQQAFGESLPRGLRLE